MTKKTDKMPADKKVYSFWLSGWGVCVVAVLCLLVFALGVVAPFWLARHNPLLGIEPGEMGDAAGAVNCLFSVFAFVGVIYAIFMQRNELEMQREELRMQYEELKGQREEFQTQNETLKRQRFENTFFNMLQLQQQITENITFTYVESNMNPDWKPSDDLRSRLIRTKIELKGREVFREAFEAVPHSTSDNKLYEGMRGLLHAEGLEGYENNFTPTHFDHYFRHLYQIIKFVHTSPLLHDDKDRYEYASMVRAQLSRYELVWLYYNGLSVYGRSKFKPLIQTYALLKNLRRELLVENLKLSDDYFSNAFGRGNAAAE